MTSAEDKAAAREPIQPMSGSELAVDTAEFDSMFGAWDDAKGRLEQENRVALDEFNERLRRSWSIETGILENLYMVDRGTTQTLIDKGFHQELVDRAGTDTDPGRLVAILKDHLAASDMVHNLIQLQRPLSPAFIKELQACLTQHQEAVEAIDSLGNPVRAPVIRGQWKTHQNYRDLPSGSRLFYCPPEQVQGQVEDLLTYLDLYEADDVNLCILSGWLHHRFTLIHPFQDANGRVARALVNYLFVKSGLFPVVVDRAQKVKYIEALEDGDRGDLKSLVDLFASKEIEAMKQALSLAGVGEPLEQEPLVKELARGIVQRLRRREEQEQEQFRQVDKVMQELWSSAIECIKEQLNEFRAELVGGLDVVVNVDSGGTHDGRDYFYRWQVIESVQQAGQWANFNEKSRWVRALVRGGTSQLRVVFSFHHVGRALTGVAEVTSIADLEDQAEAEQGSAGDASRVPVHCMLQPFTFTWRDEPKSLVDRFGDWCKNSLVMALREWAERL